MERLDRILGVLGALYVCAALLLALARFGATESRVFYLVSLLLLVPAIAACLRLRASDLGLRAAGLLGGVGLLLTTRVAVAPTLEARGYLLAFWCWAGLTIGLWLGSRRAARRMMVLLLVLAGVLEAIYGLTQSLGGMDRIFDYHRSIGRLATGTFINRNHFAGFLNMTLALAIGSLFAGYGRGRELRQRTSEIWGRAWLVLLAGAFVGLALLLSLSRGGLLTLVSMLVLVGVLLLLHGRERSSGALPPHAVAVLLLVILVLGAVVGAGSWTVRFGEQLDASRAVIYRDTLRLIADHPLSGVGPGMFEWRFGAYQTTQSDSWIRHAHNDYLEIAADWGIVLALCFWAFLIWRLSRSIRLFFTSRDPQRQGILLAGSAAIFGILIHSLIDFNLHIPANLFAFSLIVGLAWTAEWSPPRRGATRKRLPDTTARWAINVSRLLLCTALLVAGWQVRKRLEAQMILDGRPSEEQLESALRLDAQNAEIHRRLGRLALGRLEPGALESAREHLETAARLNPYDGATHYELGRVYESLGEGELAEASLLRSTEDWPDTPTHLWQLANLYLRRGELDKAMTPLRSALALDASLWDPALLLLTKLAASPEAIDSVWPNGRWPRLRLLQGLTRRAGSTGENPYLEFSLRQWAELLQGSEPLGLKEGAFFLQHLLASNEAEETRRQWIALAGANGLYDSEFESSSNAIWNGSFELPLTDGLFSWGAHAHEGVSIDRAAGQGPDGGTALRLQFAGTHNVNLGGPSQRLIVRPGARYRFTFEARPDQLTTDRGPYVEIVGLGRGERLLEFPQLLGTAGWTTFEGWFETAASSSMLELRIRRSSSRRIDSRISGSLLLDKVVLEPVPEENGP